MKRGMMVLLLTLAGAASLARAQTPAPDQRAGEDPLAKFFYPPELILQHAMELKLQQAQRTAIIDAIKDIESGLVYLRFEMAERTKELMDLLGGGSVSVVEGKIVKAGNPERLDELAVLGLVDKVLAVEADMKRRQMRLLIKIRNALTAEQREQLGKYRQIPPAPR